ncbi:MAG: gliding motility-associated C-terminal domain-containing protein [Saprospiraceae bacterium]
MYITLFLAAAPLLHGQSFLNGSFELNDLDCGYNLANGFFNLHVPHVTAVGTKSEIDVMNSTCGYGPAYDGEDFVALFGSAFSDALVLELSAPMEVGRAYVISFAYKDGQNSGQYGGMLRVGMSKTNTFGTAIYESAHAGADWEEAKIEIIAEEPYQYIGVMVMPAASAWVFIDGFHFGCPAINLGNDTAVCNVADLTLNVGTAFDSVQWSNGGIGPILRPDSPGLYWATGFYNSCIATDSIVLSELEYNCNCNIYFPNAFSPNGDGINDFFLPYTPCGLESYELLVFNRWGSLAFCSSDPLLGWGGVEGGKYAPPGIYTYLARFKYSYSKDAEFSNGDLLLIR